MTVPLLRSYFTLPANFLSSFALEPFSLKELNVSKLRV